MKAVTLCVVILLSASAARAAEYPAPKEGDWIVRDFRFHTGEVLPELRMHYTTVGAPSGEPVLVLHGTTGAAATLLTEAFAGELFGPGPPLDARRYFIILPDAIGAGKSSKPSDGLRMSFPRYNYDDMILGHYRLLTEHLGVRHLRLVIGNSMGGMLTWQWGGTYPDFMDALVPMAALPVPMSGRNWMLRRMVIDAIRNDPDWKGGSYTTQPRLWKAAFVYFGLATNGGTRAIYKAAPTREKADAYLDQRLTESTALDANDVLYQYDGARDYDPTPGLARIRARVLAIAAADDERNPIELGILERETQTITGARHVWIPASDETRGHGTTGSAKWWKGYLSELLSGAN